LWRPARLFNGKNNWVQIDLGEDAKDAYHFIDHEELLRDSGAAVGRSGE
jgi:hypothetical protein